MEVEAGKTYLLRIVNAALNDLLFFAIAGHSMTVVELDAVYCKPFTTAALLISPGQTTNVLVQANQPPGRYSMATRPFMDAPIPIDNQTATAILQYKSAPTTTVAATPTLPATNDAKFVDDFSAKLRSLASSNVPVTVDRRLLYTASLGVEPCPACLNGTRFTASLNNITFAMPSVGLLQAHYFGTEGVFGLDFPDRPEATFGSAGAPPLTRLSRVAFNSTVELVIQDTNLVTAMSHPFHLHGFNFFAVGRGVGSFDPAEDPARFNLVDPPERNTVAVPTGGWAAIRFRADNPGVWFMHCHLETHTLWGLKMAFVVENGEGVDQSVLPPPSDLPPC